MAAGLVGLSVHRFQRLLDQAAAAPAAAEADHGDTSDMEGPVRLPGLLPWSFLALGLAARRRSLRALRGVLARLTGVLGFFARPLASTAPVVIAREVLEQWGQAGVVEQRRAVAARGRVSTRWTHGPTPTR